MTHKELYSICHDEAVAYANLEQWSKRTGEEKSFLIQGYLDAMMEMRKSEITEMKKEYPKTYEECCKVLEIEGNSLLINTKHITEYERDLGNLMGQLHRLIICRDAYWKIAGEEMGLGKPWEPDWSIYEHKFCLGTDKDKIIEECVTTGNRILAFPTKEMRDAFYENFKELIESCKELL